MSFDYGKNTIQLLNIFEPILVISDPVVIQEMMVTKNAQIDKRDSTEMTFKNLFGKSFLFSPSDDVWKAKRKGLAHAFYKDKLIPMLENLKHYTLVQQSKWLTQIEQSPDKTTKIDMSREMLRILQNFFSHIIFGTNVDNIKIRMQSKGRLGENDPLTDETPYTE